MVTSRDDVVGLDSSVILPRQTWEASGHVDDVHRPADRVPVAATSGSAPTTCRRRTPRRRASTTPTTSTSPTLACPNCGTRGAWTEPRQFNSCSRPTSASIEDESGLHYLRPETAQGIFLNFANVHDHARARSRRSASPRSARASATRSRPATSSSAPASSSRWRWSSSSSRARTRSGTSTGSTSAPSWYIDLGIDPDNLRHFEHPKEKLVALLQAHRRHRVPLRLRRLASGASSRASPTAPTST